MYLRMPCKRATSLFMLAAAADSMGSVYWAGLKGRDSYSMEERSGSGLVSNNSSGVTQLRWGWETDARRFPRAGQAGPAGAGWPAGRASPRWSRSVGPQYAAR